MSIPPLYTDGTPFAIRNLLSRARVDGETLGYGVQGSGWLVAVLRYAAGSKPRWEMLTGPHVTGDDWTPIAYPAGGSLPMPLTFKDTPLATKGHRSHRRQRRALALEVLPMLHKGDTLPETVSIDSLTSCAACARPLSSNAMVRTVPTDATTPGENGAVLAGMTVAIGPGCWERVTGQAAERKATQKASADARWSKIRAKLNGPKVKTPKPKCNGTCALDVACNDCDNPQTFASKVW